MREDERLSWLIGRIYDAALDPALWVDVLGTCAEFVGGPAASLVSKDATARTGQFAFQFGLDPHYVQLYFDKYIRLDPNTTGQVLATIEEPVAVADFMSYDEFLETRFFVSGRSPRASSMQ